MKHQMPCMCQTPTAGTTRRLRSSARICGFTLLECLIALAILAVALTAALRAAGATAQSAQALRDHSLASWVAQNQLALLRAEQSWPALGRSDGEGTQAGQSFLWQQSVEPTPNPLFRRVEVQVFAADGATPLASMSGFVARPLR